MIFVQHDGTEFSGEGEGEGEITTSMRPKNVTEEESEFMSNKIHHKFGNYKQPTRLDRQSIDFDGKLEDLKEAIRNGPLILHPNK